MRSDNDTWDITTSVGATALFVAASRALEANKPNPLVVDPYAEMFCRAVGGEWADVLDGKAPENKLVSEFGHHFVNYQAARTTFFDTYFYGAADAGVRQIVIPAAGLDSRAYRLAWPTGTVVYELDQPQVLEFKGDVLRRSGESPTAERKEIAVDLRDDWQGALLGSGFDPASPSAWLVEGLLVYLPASAQGELFAGIDQLAVPGSHVAVDDGKPFSDDLYQAARDEERASADGAKFFSLIYNEQHAPAIDWFIDHGWKGEAVALTDYLRQMGRPLPGPDSEASPMFASISLVNAIKGVTGSRLAEHEVAHEARHPSQVVRLADVQDVVTREPVERAAVPVLPQRLRLLRRCEAIAETRDDQPAVLGHQWRGSSTVSGTSLRPFATHRLCR